MSSNSGGSQSSLAKLWVTVLELGCVSVGFIHPAALEAPEGDTTFLRDVSLTGKAGQGSSGHSLPLRAGEDQAHLNQAGGGWE